GNAKAAGRARGHGECGSRGNVGGLRRGIGLRQADGDAPAYRSHPTDNRKVSACSVNLQQAGAAAAQINRAARYLAQAIIRGSLEAVDRVTASGARLAVKA